MLVELLQPTICNESQNSMEGTSMPARAVLGTVPSWLVIAFAVSACVGHPSKLNPLSREQAEALLLTVQAAAKEGNPPSCRREDSSYHEGDEVRLLLDASTTDILSFRRPGDLPGIDAVQLYLRTGSKEATLGLLVYLKQGQCDRYLLSKAWS